MNTAQQYLMYALGCNNRQEQQEIAAYTVKDALSKPKSKKQFFDELSNELLNFDEIRRVLINCRTQKRQNFQNFIQSLNNYFDWLPSARVQLQAHFFNRTDAVNYCAENNADFTFEFMEALQKQAEQLVVGDIEDFKAMTNSWYFMFGFRLPSKPVNHTMPPRNSSFRFAVTDEEFCIPIEYGWTYGSDHFDYNYPFTLKDGLLFQILYWYSYDYSFATYQFDKPTEQLQTFFDNWRKYKDKTRFPFLETFQNEYKILVNDIDFLLFFRETFIEYYNFLYQQWEKNHFFNNFSLVIEQRQKARRLKKSFACSFFVDENDQLMKRPALSTAQRNLLESFERDTNLYEKKYFRTEKENKQIEEILQMKPIPATDELKKQLAATLIKFSKYT